MTRWKRPSRRSRAATSCPSGPALTVNTTNRHTSNPTGLDLTIRLPESDGVESARTLPGPRHPHRPAGGGRDQPRLRRRPWASAASNRSTSENGSTPSAPMRRRWPRPNSRSRRYHEESKARSTSGSPNPATSSGSGSSPTISAPTSSFPASSKSTRPPARSSRWCSTTRRCHCAKSSSSSSRASARR